MSDCKSEDGRILYPWVMKDVEQLWNKIFFKQVQLAGVHSWERRFVKKSGLSLVNNPA